MKCTFSDDDDMTEALPKSSHRAVNADWKPLDIHENDELETLSMSSVSISSLDENEIREEMPKKSRKFWESKGKQNRGVDQDEDQGEDKMPEEVPKKGTKRQSKKGTKRRRVRDDVSGGHVKEQENENGEHEEPQEDNTLDHNEVPEREQVEEQEQGTVEDEEFQVNKTLDHDEVPEQEKVPE